MNTFFLDLEIPRASVTLRHGDACVFLGSCFSDEMASKLNDSGHHVLSNPFGTVFHPSMLAHGVLNSLDEHASDRIVQRDDLYFSWDAGARQFGYSEAELTDKMNQARAELAHYLQNARYLFVTFGTAWGYELTESNELVANCHKVPANHFTKVLSSPYELVQDWILALEQLRNINPTLQVVFTVSPVRHVRDGLVENNLSKARLLEAAHQLAMEEQAAYFPSYELIVDVLRDYRFFSADKVHPTEEAIDFVWNRFSETFFDATTRELNERVVRLRRSLQHKVLFPKSAAARTLREQNEQAIEALLQQHPEVRW